MRHFPTIVALAAIALLAACESDEERAGRHFENGVELYDAGDVDRARVEFRNVLELDPNHKEARILFARIALDAGNRRAAIDSYLRVVEQYPDVLEGRLALAELAAFGQDWDEAERHGRAAVELAPEDPEVRVIATVLDYRQALLDRDDAARREALSRAEVLAPDHPDSVILRNVLVDGRNWQGDYRGALEQVDAAIELQPDHKPLYFSRLSILGAMGDDAATEAHLREMVTRFPDDEAIKGTLIRYLLATGEPVKAEAFFREFADPNGSELGPYAAFIRFLAETRGNEAAIAELAETAEGSPHSHALRAMRAGMRFDTGERDAAIAEMEAVLADEPPFGLAGNLRVALAQMLLATGNEVGARARVEEVLGADPGNVEALKMQAGWLIEADEVDKAIATLRSALENQPGDVEALTLMARAYSRAGRHELSRDTLSAAVSASNSAPGPSLRYAAVLIEDGLTGPAESVLVDALRLAPDNVPLLSELGRIYLLDRDIPRGRGVLRRLEEIGTELAVAEADQLRLGLLAAEERTEELMATLEGMATGADADDRARMMLIRSRLAEGDAAGALRVAEEGLAAAPDDPEAHLVLAAARAAVGDLEGAIEGYRGLIERGDADSRVHRLLTAALAASGEAESARNALAEGLAAFPDDVDLLWMHASLLEQQGDIDGAIAVYERLYSVNSGSLIVANNLASLLSTWRSNDAESIERAFTIARRLRGTRQPAFQDTYGWILHLRGDSEEALEYLEPAADALGGDAIVQYHYGMALLGAGRAADAAQQLERALGIAGPDDPRPQFDVARAQLETIGDSEAGETSNEN